MKQITIKASLSQFEGVNIAIQKFEPKRLVVMQNVTNTLQFDSAEALFNRMYISIMAELIKKLQITYIQSRKTQFTFKYSFTEGVALLHCLLNLPTDKNDFTWVCIQEWIRQLHPQLMNAQNLYTPQRISPYAEA